jgi:pimeloyl-ACP methyl ester carboxylesterase
LAVVLSLLALFAALAIAGRVYQIAGERKDRALHPPPGRIERGIHIFEEGDGPAPVLLEAGIAASSASWRLVQDRLMPFARVVAYDRKGYAWSPPPDSPRTLQNLLAEAAALERPGILVGHSFGGLLVRHAAAAGPARVRALVLLDPLMPFEWHPLSQRQSWRLKWGVRLSRRGATLAKYGVVRFALNLLLSGSHWLPKLIATAASGPGVVVPNRIVGQLRKLPSELWPAVRAHWCQTHSFHTMGEYLRRLPEYCAAPVDDSPLARIPITVISAETSPPEVIEAHRRLAALSPRGRHVVAAGATHWIQLDAPDLVAQEVRRIMDSLESSSLASS